MSDARLIVAGKKYGGWRSVRVTRSIESLAGSFDLEVTDRWTDLEQYQPIAEEDPCRVEIDDQVVIDGYIEGRSINLSAQARALSYSGRDAVALLVDCSAIPPKWAYRNVTVAALAEILAEPFGIRVSVQQGLSLPSAPGKTAISPGDSAFDVLAKMARAAGVLLVSDGAGGLLITRSGSSRAASAIVEGKNMLSGTVDYDGRERFRRYVVLTQTASSDRMWTELAGVPTPREAGGNATRIRAEQTDSGVAREERVLILRPEQGMTTEYAQQRADWEARIRAAKAERVTVMVVGWTQPNGELWPLNALVRVQAPTLRGDGDLLISQVTYSLDDGGETTQLFLVRPDAFAPEPALVRKAVLSAAKWKELDGLRAPEPQPLIRKLR